MLSRLFDDSKPGKHMRFVRGKLENGILTILFYRTCNDLQPYHSEEFKEAEVPKRRRRILNWLKNREAMLA